MVKIILNLACLWLISIRFNSQRKIQIKKHKNETKRIELNKLNVKIAYICNTTKKNISLIYLFILNLRVFFSRIFRLFLLMTITFDAILKRIDRPLYFLILFFFDDLLPNAYLHNFMKENAKKKTHTHHDYWFGEAEWASRVSNRIMHL